MLNKIGFLWDLHDEDWRSMYNLLVQYYRENGNTNVPGRHPTLCKWVNRNRMARKNGKLSDERIKLLDDIDFIWDTREDNWRKMYFLLKNYLDQNGDTLVPARYPPNPSLGVWVAKQREAYRKEKLSVDRIKLLNEIGFKWDPLNN